MIQVPELESLLHVTCILGKAPPAPVPDSLLANCCCAAAGCTLVEWLRFALRALLLHLSCLGIRLCCCCKALLEQSATWDLKGLKLTVPCLATCPVWGLHTHPGALPASSPSINIARQARVASQESKASDRKNGTTASPFVWM